ncbi:hypothetical protein ACJ73_06412 [Blastomyces percursus]|uniref:SAP domain-containing protein n=1 Tax=Blastomyces percursus TaxID=1658174 RepID=A0A1J9QPX1_9EURO|nr:hypothetical protein ACJ73_06412 [Blastomyces percursus]
MTPPTCPKKWLSSLKVRQLQRLASLTGILSSGTKPVLIERLGQVLNSEPRCAAQNASQEESLINHKKPASILSIDMGIRNLAFAHLVVPPGQAGELKSPVLNAWYRLSVPSFVANLTSDKQVLDFHLSEEMKLQNKIPKGSRSKALDMLEASQYDGKVKEKEKGKEKEKEKESFAPKLYATHAYTLISFLLSTCKPTHVLIERQRFRSGGGISVQEWTIRVGVFEGMLYAVLRAIQLERKGDLTNIVVEGVEPQRVMKYWMDDEEELGLHPKGKTTKVSSTKKSQSMTPNRRKQIKIDRIGKLLSSCTRSDAGGIGPADLDDNIGIQFGDDRRMHEVVRAYLRKWGKKMERTNADTRGNSTKPIASSTASSNKVSYFATDDLQTLEIEKLDDLADCLLQAMTWLEWQNTRQRIARCGLEAVSSKIGN